MRDSTRIDGELERALHLQAGPECPPRLARALRHAVLSGGGRLRPRLLAAVAAAAGEPDEQLVDQAGAAIELLHCASLVHDDLPCFDDAPLRRGVASVQAAFGEATAVLAGDALIVGAFSLVASIAERAAHLGAPLLRILVAAAGAPCGMAAGQAWENEPTVDLTQYHQSKTASLFEAATMAGALLAGDRPERWRLLGSRLGRAYQVIDDLRDVDDHPAANREHTGSDAALGRPNASLLLGRSAALELLHRTWGEVLGAIPACVGHDDLVRFLSELREVLSPVPLGEPARTVPTAVEHP